MAEEQEGREASASDGDAALAKDEVSLSEDEAGSKRKMKTRELLRLLTEGRGITDIRLRVGRAKGVAAQNAPEHEGGRALSEELYDPLRDLLNSGLFDEEVRAILEEAFTPGTTDTEGAAGEESIDAERLHREMQEAFERFHASLKRIFRIVEEAEESEWEEGDASDKVEAHAEAAAEAERSEEVTREYEEFVREVITTVQEALEDPQGDEDSADEYSSLIEIEGGGAYERFISAYEELYDRSSERSPSFSTEG